MTPVERSAETVIVTASYSADIDRCRLLCETMDRHVSNCTQHVILVSGPDLGLFKGLESRTRTVVDERDLLPDWLKNMPDPFSLFRKRLWVSARVPPLRGWHVQQLRRIAYGRVAEVDTLLYCDSDVAFIRPFDCYSLRSMSGLRFLKRANRLREPGHDEQRIWSVNAGRSLGIAGNVVNDHDYIGTVIAWDRATVEAMCRKMEEVSGRHWIESLARSRRFSECMAYGRFVDDILRGSGHSPASDELCKIYWTGEGLDRETLSSFIGSAATSQVAVGLQSFIGMDIDEIRRALPAS